MAKTAKVTFADERCKGCGLCVDACPKKIITLSGERFNQKGFHPAELTDGTKCTGCAFCAIMCPDVAIKVEKED